MKDYEQKTKKLSRKVYKQGKRIAAELIRRNRFRDAARFLDSTHTFVAAGVGGQFRWLRRSSGSYAERECPGNGRRILGHQSDRIFHVHYEDHKITGENPIDPPDLPLAI